MANQTNSTQAFSEEKFNRIVAVLIAIVTLAGAVIAYLQGDAAGRDSQANRDSLRYLMEGLGDRISGDARVNFDYNKAYQAYYEFNLLANSSANREDELASTRYAQLADESTKLSPMLAPPYYDPKGEGDPDISKYESDVYLVDSTALMQKYLSAASVKETWDYKANTYIIHLTLIAISLFLFGLSATISGNTTRWIFSGGGSAIALIAIGWAAIIYSGPVFDLREQGNAIKSYSEGVGLSYQEKYPEAIAAFDSALNDYPQYASALTERGNANASQGQYEAAIADYEKAIAAGDSTPNTAGQLAYMHHLVGNFEKAIEMDRVALKGAPDELWLQFDLALNLLASGKEDEAKAEYDRGMKLAIEQVAQARKAGGEPPSYLWEAMIDAADSLDLLVYNLDESTGNPPPDKIVNPDAVLNTGTEMLGKLKSLALALEYTGESPKAELTATISPFQFAEPTYDDQGEPNGYNEPADTFADGLKEFGVLFDYSGMKDGSEYIFKLYINGEEDPSWRIVEPWSLGDSGSAEIPVSYAYSDTFSFAPGEYVVELYVDYQLAQRGVFTITE